MNLRQIGVGRRGIGLKQLDGDLRLAMGGQQALGIGQPRRSRKVGAVDRVAAVAGQRNPVDGFAGRRARLGELPGDPGEMNDIAAARGTERGAHPQQQIIGDADLVGIELGETLGAVAALDNEGVTLGNARQSGAQMDDVGNIDQRIRPGEASFDAGQRAGVGIFGKLCCRTIAPAGG